MASTLTPERPRTPVFLAFLGLSLLLHLALLAWLNRSTLTSATPEEPELVVKLAPPVAAPAVPQAGAKAPAGARAAAQAPPKQQIVAPSDAENSVPPVGAAYLSDRDNRVEKETVKRGNPEAGAPGGAERPPEAIAKAPAQPAPPAPREAKPAPRAPAAEAPAARPRSAAPRPQERAAAKPPPGDTVPSGRSLPGLDQLLLPPDEVLAKADTQAFERGRPADRAGPAARPADDPRRDLLGGPPPARGIFGGQRGTFDDLPGVAQGSLTFLNTKADRFAPFVRRVGTRVFQNLLIYQRRDLDLKEILAAHEAVTVHAVLDRSGRLKSVDVEDRSGSHAVDQTLLDALREAAFDQNPPASAANADGEFEFIFQAQLAALLGPGGGGAEQVRAIESRLRVGLL